MQVVTDIAPFSESSPAPETSWRRWQPAGDIRDLLTAIFPDDRPLYSAEDTGRKMTREFPLIVWRARADRSQLEQAAELDKTLPLFVKSVVLVAEQCDGLRGHYDRKWHSAPGNLHVTILLRETLPAEFVGLGYAVLPVLALADCAESIAGGKHTIRIKWINDILSNGAKIGGALSRASVQSGYFSDPVLGMGLNLTTTPEVPPTVFVPRVGNLGDVVSMRNRLDVLKRLLSAFHANHYLLTRKGAKGLADRYRRLSSVVGRTVRVYEDGPGLDDMNIQGRKLLARGTVQSIDDQLRLVVDGERIMSGRLAFEEDCQAFGIDS